AGPNDAANMARIMQEIQRLSAVAGIAPAEITRKQPEAPAAPATAPKPDDTERRMAVERTRLLKPWITEGEIQAQSTLEDLERLVEVGKARREAAREKRILDAATPEERAT